MKKRIVFLGLVILMICIASIAYCEISIFCDDTVNYQVDLSADKTTNGGFYSRGPELWLNGYEEGSEYPEWSLTCLDGGPAFSLATFDWYGGVARFTQLPNITYTAGGSYNYRVSCTWNGETCTKDITINFIKQSAFPSGYYMTVAPVDMTTNPPLIGTEMTVQNGIMYMTSGENYVVTQHFRNTAGVFTDYEMKESDWTTTEWMDYDPTDEPFVDENNNSIFEDIGPIEVVIAKKPGEYQHNYVVWFKESNLAYYVPYTLQIVESDPDELENGNSEWKWYIDLTEDHGWNDGTWSMPGFIQLYIPTDDWNAGVGGNPAEPTWTVANTSTNEGIKGNNFIYRTIENGKGIALSPKAAFQNTGDGTYRIDCSWNGKQYSTDITVHFTSRTNYPSGMTISVNKFDMSTLAIGESIPVSGKAFTLTEGQYYVITAHYADNQPTMEEYSFLNAHSNGLTGYNRFEEQFKKNGEYILKDNQDVFKAGESGTYRLEATLSEAMCNLYCSGVYTLNIADQGGNVAAPQLENAPVEATWYVGLPWGSAGHNGLQSMSAIGQMWFPEELRDYDDLNITWELVYESGEDNFELYYNPYSWQESYFNASAQPKSGTLTPGNSVYTMKATYKGETYEGKLTLHTVDTGYPTGATFRVFETNGSNIGNEVFFSNDTLTVESGKSYWFSGLFTGGTAAPTNQWINNRYAQGSVTQGQRWQGGDQAAYGIYTSNTQMFTALTPGTYSTEADLSIGSTNLAWSMPFTMVITNPSTGDPYFPEPQISIKQEYYADEEVLISLPWVNGADYHEIRIFSIDGTEPYNWGNVHWDGVGNPNTMCSFQINVDAGAGQNRLMDPGDYYAIITVTGPGYRDTTFRRDFTILSSNSGGHNDDPNGLENGNSEWTWYVDLEDSEYGTKEGTWSADSFLQVRIPESEWSAGGGNSAGVPSWSITNTSQDTNLKKQNYSYQRETSFDGRGIVLLPQNTFSYTGDGTYIIACDWNNKHYSTNITVHYVERPPYPSAITIAVNEYDLDTLTIGNPVATAADGSFALSEGKYYLVTANYKDNTPVSNNSSFLNAHAGGMSLIDRFGAILTNHHGGSVINNNQNVYKAEKAGVQTFEATLTIGMSNMNTRNRFTMRIADATGNVPGPQLQISDNRSGTHEMNFYLGMRYSQGTFYIGEVQTEPQIDHFYLDNANTMKAAYPNDNVQWTLTKLQGTAELEMDVENYDYDMDLGLKKLPNGLEDAKWKITCDWGTEHWETVYTVHFMSSPTGLPTGIDMDFGDVLVVRSGERLGLDSKVRFRNNWSIPGEYIDTMIGGAGNIFEGVTHDENWIWDVAAKPGVYDANVSKMCGNIRWIENFTLIVTEADGTMRASDYKHFGTVAKVPAGIQRIESEAFMGTKITEIDIPSGVEIAEDAFEDSGLIAVYTHNDEMTIEWAVSHGVVAVTEQNQ